MANLISGKQSNEYYKDYYQKNRDVISKRNKARYVRDRSSPEKLLRHRELATAATRRYRLKHPERTKQIRQNVYKGRKLRVLEKVSKNGKICCEGCGCTELSFLEINHLNGGGSKEFKENRKNTQDRILKGERKTDDLNILCRVCNALDHLARKNIMQSKRFNVKWE